MRLAGRSNPAVVAIFATAIASSLLTFVGLMAAGFVTAGLIGLPSGPDLPLQIAIFLSIIFFWGPAFALIPSAVLGLLLERPLSRRYIRRPQCGFAEHLIIIIAAALLLWLLLRVAVVLAGPQTRIFDPLSLFVFAVIGLCSALSWWFLVIVPGRQG